MLYSAIVPEPVVEIPNRPAFRASEVCEIAGIPPYVLKSWEKEFPNLGVPAKPGGPRIYRRVDVEQVVRIKHLLFAEGLTLAGARRKLEGEPKPEDEALPDLSIPVDVREKVARIRHGLRGLLDLLSEPAASAPAMRETAPGAQRVKDDERAAPAPRTEPDGSAALPLLDGVAEDLNPSDAPRGRRSAHRK